MRNQLTKRSSMHGSTVYSAAGTLDGREADVLAFSHDAIVIGFGLGQVSLSTEAAAELVEHLTEAMAPIGEVLK